MPENRTLLIAAGVLAAVLVLVWRPWSSGPAPDAAPPAQGVDPATEARFQQALAQQQAGSADPRAAAEQQVAEFRRQFEADTAAPDAPALLSAMGNLAANKLRDDAEAIRCYELIVLNYPEWPEARGVYPLLEAAYERTGNAAQLAWLYQEMMKRFPEDAQEHLYAKTKLGL